MKANTSPVPQQRRHVSLADVARLAGVSQMTVSYALRNNPKISLATRQRVQRAARKAGYVPHPEIGRLLHLLRAKRMRSYEATLGFLSFAHDAHPVVHSYTSNVIAGAKSRAVALGYTVDLFNVDTAQLSQIRLTTMLKGRGIRGVLIPPLPAMEDCAQLLDWSQFSIVAATYSAQNLPVNRVVPHHQNNIIRAIQRMKILGHHRLGLVLTDDIGHRTNFAYQAAFALRQQLGELAFIPVLTLDLDHPEQLTGLIVPWVREFQPEVILAPGNASDVLCSEIGRLFRSEIEICLLDHSGVGKFAGIHQHPLIIGETATDLLARQVQHGEIGFPPHPLVTMVEGRWLDGATLHKRPLASRAKP
ncbi:MAG: LacI family DNA-binding transcriptional regulator [Nitrospira sp.]|nr:LacI family DNA-binding transcriptional regulator [Nitrospira sp.]